MLRMFGIFMVYNGELSNLIKILLIIVREFISKYDDFLLASD